MRAASLPEGRLPGPRRENTGLPETASKPVLGLDPRNVDRQIAGAVVVRVEEGEPLAAVHRILGVVDVELDACGWRSEAAAEEVDHAEPDAAGRAPLG